MPIHRVVDDVERGVKYLDVTYPGWWMHVDLPLMRMDNMNTHVLCYATGWKIQDTYEFTFWSRAALQMCGFLPRGSMTQVDVLTATWVVRINEIREERK